MPTQTITQTMNSVTALSSVAGAVITYAHLSAALTTRIPPCLPTLCASFVVWILVRGKATRGRALEYRS